MPKDMRTWIEHLERAGELSTIRRAVNPHSQMGTLLAQSLERALLFENLPGYPGWRVLGQGVANIRHAALAFGTTPDELTAWFAKRMALRQPCERVEGGPVKEVVLRGDEIDLTGIPFHVNGEADAAPYITAGLVITRDPDDGTRNMAIYRLQIKGKSRTGIMVAPNHHAAHHLRKYEARGEPMPVAICIGHHPAYYFASTSILAIGDDELELAGALMGEPVRMAPCETVPLEVPADAEMVLEGYIPPHVREDEGPFTEFQDYCVGETGPKPVIEIKALTMRRDAICRVIQNGATVEGATYIQVPVGADLYRDLRLVAGHADIKNVMFLPSTFGVIIQMAPRFYGEAKNILLAAISSPSSLPKIAIAVDEDVDVSNPYEVFWAVCARVDPAKDVSIVPGLYLNHLDITGDVMKTIGRGSITRFGSKMVIDATKPPSSDPEARRNFDRVRPTGSGSVWLKDFLGG